MDCNIFSYYLSINTFEFKSVKSHNRFLKVSQTIYHETNWDTYLHFFRVSVQKVFWEKYEGNKEGVWRVEKDLRES